MMLHTLGKISKIDLKKLFLNRKNSIGLCPGYRGEKAMLNAADDGYQLVSPKFNTACIISVLWWMTIASWLHKHI